MMTFGVWRWNGADGGMRFAFPPYYPDGDGEDHQPDGVKFSFGLSGKPGTIKITG